MPVRMHDDEVDVDVGLVRRLVDDQYPDLAGLPLVEVRPWGTDHAIWRLGDELVVRLPRIGWAAGHPVTEATWLPRLAPLLPVEVPTPVALGRPGHGYPFSWTIARWLDGVDAETAEVDTLRLAAELAAVIHALAGVPTTGAPTARSRARPLADYDHDARAAVRSTAAWVDVEAALGVWDDARAAPPYAGPPRWVHGDLAGNCLVREGRLSGVIDWGGACVGDPAVDVAVIWTPLVPHAARAAFLDAAAVDDATVRRSRGAALHQACAALPYYAATHPPIVRRARHQLRALGVAGDAGPDPDFATHPPEVRT